MNGNDDRFSYAADPKASSTGKQYILGDEIVTITPRNNPTEFAWGQTYEFPVDDVPFLISKKNHLLITYKIEAKGSGKTLWEKYKVASDYSQFIPVENFGSAFIEEVGMRQGLDPMDTDGFVPRGRYLYENFLMAHTSRKVRQQYAISKRDPALFCYQNENVLVPTKKEFYTAFGKGDAYEPGDDPPADCAFTTPTTMCVVPHAFPFQYRNRSTMHDVLFPNSGNPLTITIKLHSSYRHLFSLSSAATSQFRIVVQDIKLVLATPRLSQEGYDLIRNRSLRPLRYEGHFVKQYAQVVSANPNEINLVLQKIPMPQYMLIQMYKQEYFTGTTVSDFKYDDRPCKPLPFKIKTARLRFGNRDLSYQTANFDVEKQGSDVLRQEILKNSDVFGCSEMDQEYYQPETDSEIAAYQHAHYLFSFCSDEKNQTILRPMDYVDRKDVPDNLSMTLISQSNFPNGKMLISLIYTKAGIEYSVRAGTFAERDLNSLLLVS